MPSLRPSAQNPAAKLILLLVSIIIFRQYWFTPPIFLYNTLVFCLFRTLQTLDSTQIIKIIFRTTNVRSMFFPKIIILHYGRMRDVTQQPQHSGACLEGANFTHFFILNKKSPLNKTSTSKGK